MQRYSFIQHTTGDVEIANLVLVRGGPRIMQEAQRVLRKITLDSRRREVQHNTRQHDTYFSCCLVLSESTERKTLTHSLCILQTTTCSIHTVCNV